MKTVTMLACLVYVISPIDLMPEAFLGPLGIPDDLVAIVVGFRAAIAKRS